MNQGMEKMNPITNTSQESGTWNDLNEKADSFLGEERIFIKPEIITSIINEVSIEIDNIRKNITCGSERSVIYNKYDKPFIVGNEKKVSMGEIIASRRWGVNPNLPENLEASGDGKRVRKLMTEIIVKDHLSQKLNKVLATNLSELTKKDDARKAEGYQEIAKRSGVESKQTGIFAEQIIIGVLEGISIDRPDLGFEILEANAYQDMNNKIDFIIHSKEKVKGVGINRLEKEFQEKSIGIQFTINKNVISHKADQILKAKERGVKVDDIIYVDLDIRILQKAITEWEKAKRPIAGPWKFLPPEIKKMY